MKMFIPGKKNNQWPKLFTLFFSFSLCLLFLERGYGQNAAAKSTFRASVVKINITPKNSQNLLGYGPRMSTGTHDSIYHKIIVLDDGSTQFFLISSDICLISPTEYDHVAERIQKLYGI